MNCGLLVRYIPEFIERFGNVEAVTITDTEWGARWPGG